MTAAHLSTGQRVAADLHVFATNPFSAVEILERTPALAQLDQLCLFGPLTADGPHVQVSFRIAFSEQIRWPRERCAVVVTDSEFDLTIFAEEQAWAPAVDLGDGIASLWTGTACVSTVPGCVHGPPVDSCTKKQFIDEVQAQLLQCGSIDTERQIGAISVETVKASVLPAVHQDPTGATGRVHRWRFGQRVDDCALGIEHGDAQFDRATLVPRASVEAVVVVVGH